MKRHSSFALVLALGLVLVPTAAASAEEQTTTVADANTGAPQRAATLEGYVTSLSDLHGAPGFHLQAAGSGGQLPSEGGSDAILVTISERPTDLQIGQFVSVRGITQDAHGTRVLAAEAMESKPATGPAPSPVTGIDGVAADEFLATEAGLVRVQGMLVALPEGWAVAANDQAATRGEIDVAPAGAPLGADSPRPPVVLDDGLGVDYTVAPADRTAPWTGGESPRIGATVTGSGALIPQASLGVDGLRDGWHLQPTVAFDGATPVADRPYAFTGAETSAPALPTGDLVVASADLGNYFPVSGPLTSPEGTTCAAVADRAGDAVAIRGGGSCQQLGAASDAAFDVQRSKVLAMLEGMSGADVIALQGIANPTIDPAAAGEHQRIAQALSERTGAPWAAVAPPAGVAGSWTSGFVFRTDRLTAQGDPIAFQGEAYAYSSTPIAQTFVASNGAAVALVSVRFSAQGESDYSGDRDARALAGTNAERRAAEIDALGRTLTSSTDAARTVVLGSFGSLSGDEVLAPIEQTGARDVVAAAGLTTVRDGDVTGSLVHAYVPEAMVSGDAIAWPINSGAAATAGFAYRGAIVPETVDANDASRSSSVDPVAFAVRLPQGAAAVGAAVRPDRAGDQENEASAPTPGTPPADGTATGTTPAATAVPAATSPAATAPSTESGSSGSTSSTQANAPTVDAATTTGGGGGEGADGSSGETGGGAPSTEAGSSSAGVVESVPGSALSDSERISIADGDGGSGSGAASEFGGPSSPAAGLAVGLIVAVVLGTTIVAGVRRARRS